MGIFMNAITLIIIYFIIMNICGFTLMGIDKRKAIKRLWRIPESVLFIVALIGGSIGCILGMQLFRHKTRTWNFVYGMPAILILQVVIFLFILNAPIQFLTI